MRYYKVTYSRLLAGSGRRIELTDVEMSERDLKLMLLDDKSRMKYIVISAKLIQGE